jgi:hypothetical protein
MRTLLESVYFTPPQLGKRYRCKPSKIIALIRAGELRGIDTALPGSSRPRFVISPEAVAEFERRRSVGPLPAPVRRRKLGAVKSFV